MTYTVSALGPRFAVTRGADVCAVFDTAELAHFLIQLLTGDE